jgi:hypothetical protein
MKKGRDRSVVDAIQQLICTSYIWRGRTKSLACSLCFASWYPQMRSLSITTDLIGLLVVAWTTLVPRRYRVSGIATSIITNMTPKRMAARRKSHRQPTNNARYPLYIELAELLDSRKMEIHPGMGDRWAPFVTKTVKTPSARPRSWRQKRSTAVACKSGTF